MGDDDWKVAKGKQKAETNRTSCKVKGCIGSIPTQTLGQRSKAGQISTCSVCGGRYARLLLPPGSGEPPKVRAKAKPKAMPTQSPKELTARLAELEAENAKLKADKSSISDGTCSDPELLPDDGSAAIKETILQDEIKMLNDRINQLKNMGQFAIERMGDPKPHITEAEARKVQVYLLIRNLKPMDEQVKSAQTRADQLAKQLANAERIQKGKAEARDKAQELVKVAQQALDKQSQVVAEIQVKTEAAKQEAEVLKAQTAKVPNDAREPIDAKGQQEHGDLTFVLSLMQKLGASNPQFIQELDSEEQAKVRDIVQKVTPKDAQTATITDPSTWGASNGLHQEMEDDEEFHSAFRSLADEATPMVDSELPEARAKRVDSAADRMAKKAKSDGHLKILRTNTKK